MLLRIILVWAALAVTATAQQNETAYAFENVNVIPMDGEHVLENHTVLVRGDRITEVGPAGEVSIPGGARRIDGSGKYLIPGLAEMHGHIPPLNLPDSYPEKYVENVLFLYVAAGVTTVRGMLGAPGQLELRDRVLNGELTGPTLYLAGPSFSGNSINSPEQAVERARRQKEEGWDLLKIHPGLTLEEYNAMAKTAHEEGISFGGHIPQDVGLAHALERGQLTIDHLDGYIAFMDAADKPVDEQKLKEAVALSIRSGVWVVPTLALWETIIGAADYDAMARYEELKYMPGVVVNQWKKSAANFKAGSEEARRAAAIHAENRLVLLKALNDDDVPVLMGTDAPQMFSVPGFSLYRELPMMAEAGMSNYDILKSGTFMVGKHFQQKDTFGTIAENRRADLILLDANPLEDIAHVKERAGVMVRGQWLSRQEIDRRLEEIAKSYASE